MVNFVEWQKRGWRALPTITQLFSSTGPHIILKIRRISQHKFQHSQVEPPLLKQFKHLKGRSKL